MWKPSLRPSGAGSDKLSWFFQGPGLGEGFLALKRSLGDAGRFRCVWPPEEIVFFASQRGCTAVLGTVKMSWRVSGRVLQRVTTQIRVLVTSFAFKKDCLACQIT